MTGDTAPRVSVVVPLYKSAGSIDALVDRLDALREQLQPAALEVVFVDDGSPDDAVDRLSRRLPASFDSTLLRHSRNFGSFAAIRTGLAAAAGDYIGVMAADLQEPPELIPQMLAAVQASGCDVAYGQRVGREGDALRERATSSLFWRTYRRLVQPAMPEGGIDIFLCRASVAHELLQMTEANSSLVGSLVWLGFPSVGVPYRRGERVGGGKSAWSLRRRLRYMADSAFSFSRLPLTLLGWTGVLGLLTCLGVGLVVLGGHLLGRIHVPGYTALMLMLALCTSLILIALWIVGDIAWRAFENTKQRPLSVVSSRTVFEHREQSA